MAKSKSEDEAVILACAKIAEAEAAIRRKVSTDGGLGMPLSHFLESCQLLRNAVLGSFPQSERDRVIAAFELQPGSVISTDEATLPEE